MACSFFCAFSLDDTSIQRQFYSVSLHLQPFHSASFPFNIIYISCRFYLKLFSPKGISARWYLPYAVFSFCFISILLLSFSIRTFSLFSA